MSLARRLAPFLVLAAVTVAALGAWADGPTLAATLAGFPAALVPVVLALTLANQALRYAKWEYLLDRVDVDLPRRLSLQVFASGLVMILTPGKLGEVWKSWLVRDTRDVPVARTMPVVVGERVTDVLGLALLSTLGVLVVGGPPLAVAAVAGLVLGAALLLQHEGLAEAALSGLERAPVVGRWAEPARRLHASSRAVLAPVPLVLATGVSVASWSLECLGFWIVLQALGVEASLAFASFVFAAGSLLGAVSMLPGGVGAAEGSMTGLLVGLGVARGPAAGATLLIRAATLWFVAALALVAYGHFRLEHGGPSRGRPAEDPRPG